MGFDGLTNMLYTLVMMARGGYIIWALFFCDFFVRSYGVLNGSVHIRKILLNYIIPRLIFILVEMDNNHVT